MLLRFLAFPLILAVMGALFPLIAYEGILSVVVLIFRSGGTPFSPPPDIVLSIQQGTLWVAGFGAFVGLVAALFDLVLNKSKGRQARQVLANVSWCALYAQAITALNGFIVFSVLWLRADDLWRNPLNTYIFSFFPFLPLFVHFVAVGWGTVRSITTDNVLNPRRLRSKLKRSTDVET